MQEELEDLRDDGKGVLVVSEVGDLERLVDRKVRKGIRRIVLRVGEGTVEEPEIRKLEKRIARSANACGCDEGTIAGFIYIVAIASAAVAGGVSLSSAGDWGLAVGGFVASLVVGKGIGLALAELRLRLALRDAGRLFMAGKEELQNGG